MLKVESALVTTTGALQLSEQHSTILINGAHTVTLPTIANVSSATFTKRYRLINISASTGVLKTKAGGETLNGSDYSSTGLDLPAQYKEYVVYGNGTVWYMETNVVFADTMSEITAAAGVTIDGVLLKDSEVTTDTINEKTGAAGVTIDNFKIKDNAPDPTSWPSFSAYLSGDQANITSADQIEFDTEDFDTNSDFDTSTFRFTPTVAGKYLFILQIQWVLVTVTDPLNLWIFKNGSNAIQTYDLSTAGTSAYQMISVILEANGTTDYFEAFARNQSRDTSSIEASVAGTFFQASRIA